MGWCDHTCQSRVPPNLKKEDKGAFIKITLFSKIIEQYLKN